MSRADDIALWDEVNETIVGSSGMVAMFARRVRRGDRLDLAREMIAHADELEARADHRKGEVAVARLEGRVQGWREAATRLRRHRT